MVQTIHARRLRHGSKCFYVLWAALSLLLFVAVGSPAAWAKASPPRATPVPQQASPAPTSAPLDRDPRQLTVMVSDADGTLWHNVGAFRVKRVQRVEDYVFQRVNLPLEVRVPTEDFEGDVGPQIQKLLGKIDVSGRFVPGPVFDPIKLSNGESIVPGLYYLDTQTSYEEFRTPPNPADSHLLKEVDRLIAKRDPYLLEAFAFLALGYSKEYQQRLTNVILTKRGHEPKEMKQAIDRILASLGKEETVSSLKSFVNLSHPEFAKFAGNKANYLLSLYTELTNRMMSNKNTPHFLVMFENNRQYLRDIENLFDALSNRGVFINPVVPILVNLVEPEVFADPDRKSWDDLPVKKINNMARVSIFWPGRVERTNDLKRVLTLTMGVSDAEASQMLSVHKSALVCRSLLQ
jgi:hypothetical protein